MGSIMLQINVINFKTPNCLKYRVSPGKIGSQNAPMFNS